MYYDQTVIFMGCRSGEIELGFTYDAANVCIYKYNINSIRSLLFISYFYLYLGLSFSI